MTRLHFDPMMAAVFRTFGNGRVSKIRREICPVAGKTGKGRDP